MEGTSPIAVGEKVKVSMKDRIAAAEWLREQDTLFDAHDDTYVDIPADGSDFNTLIFDPHFKPPPPMPEKPVPLAALLLLWKAKMDREAKPQDQDDAPPCAPVLS